jgi:predicted unusual protein kinase regulating ubiquinone biosynthesis (AarF/ABC1/UbiB family)
MQEHRPPVIALNGQKPAEPEPVVIRGSTPRRVKKAVADAMARQNRRKPDGHTSIRVGDDWDGMGRLATLNVPDDLLPDDEPDDAPVIRPMGRRQQAKPDTEKDYSPPQMRLLLPPKIGRIKTLRRLMVWFGAILSFQLGNLWDVIHKRDSEARRAVRLRLTFEHVGGTFVKIGQQMASRLDFLPQRYCEELATMLDRFPPFPTDEAIAIIERATGKKLEEVFSAFDPEPIGSASIACVYQARLRATGEKVAVKVRRPGIRELFEADFKVLDVLGQLAETLTLVRPGYTVNLRSEFRNALSSELDFRREGRLGELFRRRANKAKERYFTAPRVHFEYSDDEVLVQEFVSGIWLFEILAAVEHGDPAGLARMEELNIDPKIIARRLLYAHNWSLYDHLSFHADPHPANIVVRANNELVFVDFGASGYMSTTRKLFYRRTYECFLKNDIAGMAQMSIVLNEPLPPMDVNAVMKETEVAFHDQMLAMRSKQTPWYERTSARMFIAMIGVISKHNVPTPTDILMFTRATLLYDTLAARLDPKINFYREYQRYAQKAARKTKKRARQALMRRFRGGLQGADYVLLEKLLSTGDDLIFRAQRLMSVPYDFAVLPFMVEKWIFTTLTVVRFLVRTLIITALGVGIVAGVAALNRQPIPVGDALVQAVNSVPYVVVIALLALLHIRLILFRLGDKTRIE